jgi:predicted TIM-barrel fold metal-dependent hydrolase
MPYRIISADCHMDSEFLPRDTFTARVPGSLKERVPQVRDTGDRTTWFAGDVKLGDWGFYRTKARVNVGKRSAAMLAAGFDPEQLRPSNPALRIEDQDRDGVDAELLYGPLRRWKYLAPLPPDAAAATCAAYNQWIAEFCASRPGRFFALGGVPIDDVQAIVRELRHIAELGLAGAEVPFTGSTPVWDPSWEPLWAAAADLDVPIHVHVPAVPTTINPALPSRAVFLCTSPMNLKDTLASVIFSGALERHPNLKVVMAESGTGWIPYLLDRMDYEWEDAYVDWKALCATKPSEQFRRQMFATFQEDHIGPQLAHLYPDSFMWGSDYPHADGIWPDSQQKIRETMGRLDEGLRTKLLRDNAARLYHIDVAAPAKVA